MAPPSFTATWHRDTYPAIDPRSRPELSMRGKTVVISGGGSGIGRALAQSFAEAGASTIAIVGRRIAPLQDTKQAIERLHSDVSVAIHVADVANGKAIEQVASEIGPWDVLIANAGYMLSLIHI